MPKALLLDTCALLWLGGAPERLSPAAKRRIEAADTVSPHFNERSAVAAGLTIRAATADDVDALAAAEAEAFPPAEASPRSQFAGRVVRYPNHFWLLIERQRLVAFVTGLTTDRADLEDEMFKNAGLHDERGAWQMILSVVTVPDRRGRGLAGHLLNRVIADARAQGRKGLVLTCKDHLVAYYAKFGFVDEGIGKSRYGGVPWHQMRLELAEDSQ